MATVDSGASRSLLPLATATLLGVEGSLQEDPNQAEGVGSVFKTSSLPQPITAQIIGNFPTGKKLVGPKFNLSPGFAETNAVLLGRSDFFQAFQITFHENLVAPLFHLDW